MAVKTGENRNNRSGKGMMTAILSLSLLTVMAGAAVAPALGTLQEHFADSGSTTVQLIISMPALFIFLSSFIFPKLCSKLGSKTLVLIGLALYVGGGCGASLVDNIAVVLVFRALVGCGVGLIMPMSTGLLSYYYPPEKLDGLMGLSSAMNQMGGAIATFIAGLLATISWRAVFMVYLMGLISIVPVLVFLPNDMIGGGHQAASDKSGDTRAGGTGGSDAGSEKGRESALKKYFIYVASMFVLMSTFFIYPSNYSLEMAKDGFMSQQAVATVMALMDVVAFLGGLCYVKIRDMLGSNAHFAAPLLFTAGYLIMAFAPNAALSIIGSFMVGFANGAGIPCIIAAASHKAGRAAVSTVMPLLSAAMYIAQFLSPFIMSAVKAVAGGTSLNHLPFIWAAVLGIILAALAAGMRKAE